MSACAMTTQEDVATVATVLVCDLSDDCDGVRDDVSTTGGTQPTSTHCRSTCLVSVLAAFLALGTLAFSVMATTTSIPVLWLPTNSTYAYSYDAHDDDVPDVCVTFFAVVSCAGGRDALSPALTCPVALESFQLARFFARTSVVAALVTVIACALVVRRGIQPCLPAVPALATAVVSAMSWATVLGAWLTATCGAEALSLSELGFEVDVQPVLMMIVTCLSLLTTLLLCQCV